MQNVVVRMLRDFVELRPGDCVLQNGANSAVGQVMVDQWEHGLGSRDHSALWANHLKG